MLEGFAARRVSFSLTERKMHEVAGMFQSPLSCHTKLFKFSRFEGAKFTATLQAAIGLNTYLTLPARTASSWPSRNLAPQKRSRSPRTTPCQKSLAGTPAEFKSLFSALSPMAREPGG